MRKLSWRVLVDTIISKCYLHLIFLVLMNEVQWNWNVDLFLTCWLFLLSDEKDLKNKILCVPNNYSFYLSSAGILNCLLTDGATQLLSGMTDTWECFWCAGEAEVQKTRLLNSCHVIFFSWKFCLNLIKLSEAVFQPPLPKQIYLYFLKNKDACIFRWCCIFLSSYSFMRMLIKVRLLGEIKV